MDILSESIGLSPSRPPRAPRASPRDSEVFERVNVPDSRAGSETNIIEHYSNARTPAPKTPALNSEQRKLLERALKNQNIDPSNISPIRPDVLRGGFSSSPNREVVMSNAPQTNRLSDTLRSGRPSGIQQHDGVSTRSIRAETGEAHTQYQTPARGRPRIRPFGPQTQPNRRGRPTNTELAARAAQEQQAQLQTPTRGVTRNMSNWKSNEKKK